MTHLLRFLFLLFCCYRRFASRSEDNLKGKNNLPEGNRFKRVSGIPRLTIPTSKGRALTEVVSGKFWERVDFASLAPNPLWNGGVQGLLECFHKAQILFLGLALTELKELEEDFEGQRRALKVDIKYHCSLHSRTSSKCCHWSTVSRELLLNQVSRDIRESVSRVVTLKFIKVFRYDVQVDAWQWLYQKVDPDNHMLKLIRKVSSSWKIHMGPADLDTLRATHLYLEKVHSFWNDRREWVKGNNRAVSTRGNRLWLEMTSQLWHVSRLTWSEKFLFFFERRPLFIEANVKLAACLMTSLTFHKKLTYIAVANMKVIIYEYRPGHGRILRNGWKFIFRRFSSWISKKLHWWIANL